MLATDIKCNSYNNKTGVSNKLKRKLIVNNMKNKFRSSLINNLHIPMSSLLKHKSSMLLKEVKMKEILVQ